ncbi:MAG TPA: hypothetical protein VML55_20470 [Planctomycetaceae bacterium]|nr:hypothetical protein [Planctomycetaceae bacterium]
MDSPGTTWPATVATAAPLEVYLLGVVDFESALFLQERLVYEISGRNDRQGALLVCEHPPIVTVGREGSRAHIRAEPRELAARLISVRWLNRGGGCFVHAPGQLVACPIVPLDRLGLGLADYRERLELAVVDAAGEQRVPAFRRDDEPGVWSRRGQFAHVGVAVKSWVAYHGVYVNVAPAPELMRLVQANRAGERVTSLAALRERTVPMSTVREALIRRLVARLGYARFHIYTGHPLLRRTQQRVYAGV